MKKIGISLIMCMVMLLVAPMTTFADTGSEPIGRGEIVLNYTNASKATARLRIDSGVANMTVRVVGIYGKTTKISATASLQKYSAGSWRTVETWSKSTASINLTLSKTKAVSKGKYRVHAVIKAYKNGKAETITVNSNTASY